MVSHEQAHAVRASHLQTSPCSQPWPCQATAAAAEAKWHPLSQGPWAAGQAITGQPEWANALSTEGQGGGQGAA
jgi:hypothetical protein